MWSSIEFWDGTLLEKDNPYCHIKLRKHMWAKPWWCIFRVFLYLLAIMNQCGLKKNPAAGPAGSILKRISLSPGPGVLCHVHGEMIQWTALKCWGTRHRDATTFRKVGISEPNFCRCLHRQSSSEGPRRQFVFKEWQLPKCVYQPKSSKRQGALREVSNANGASSA